MILTLFTTNSYKQEFESAHRGLTDIGSCRKAGNPIKAM